MYQLDEIADIIPHLSTPAEIDEALSTIYRHFDRARASLDHALESLARQEQQGISREQVHGETYDEARERYTNFYGQQIRRMEIMAIPFEQEFRDRGRWTRWYLVDGGHLHSDNRAWRCNRTPSTRHYWMTELSGMPRAEVIEMAQDLVCTVCFSEAPVAIKPAHPRLMTPEAAEREAYRELEAQKKAAKLADQMTTPEGGVLWSVYVGPHGELKNDRAIKTLVAARRMAMEAAADLAIWFGPDHPSAPGWRETFDRMVVAIAHRTGTDLNTVRIEIRNKITKKARREQLPVLTEV